MSATSSKPKVYPSPPLSRSSHDSEDELQALEYSEGPVDARHTRSGRSYSMSGFDFQHALLPLAASMSDPETMTDVTSEKSIGLINGIALVVSLQIGSGIFSSPGIVVANTHSVGASLLVWLASGILAWTGASSFAELGSAIPLNGGAQAYLAYAYNPLISYLFTWTAIVALKPGGTGIIALIFAEYLNRLIYHAAAEDVAPNALPQWSIKLTASLTIVVIAVISVATRNTGTRVAVVFFLLKLITLIAIAILALFQLARGRASPSFREPIFEDSSHSPSAYALALYSGLWAIDGWDQINYVGGEIKDPGKTMPRVIHSSMAIVVTLFLVANISYFVVLDKTTVGLSNTVALDFGRAVLGPVGGVIFTAAVTISCFGAINSALFSSARLIYVAGKEGYLPKLFGTIHKTRKTPINAMCLQVSLTLLYTVFGGGFRTLLNFGAVASWAFYFITVLGLVILRFKEPDLPRPYKTWMITPLLFCSVALFLLLMPIIAAPVEALAVLGFVSAGVPVYFLTRKPNSTSASRISKLLSPFSSCLARLRARSLSPNGWMPVATEADEGEGENVEMHVSSGHPDSLNHSPDTT